MTISQCIGINLGTVLYSGQPTHRATLSINHSCIRRLKRLKFYLRQGNIDEDEILHSFRSGCALTLAFSGSSLADVMTHMGWRNSSTASYYMKLAGVLRAGAPTDVLTFSSSNAVEESSRLYGDYNHLKDFIQAFPGDEHPHLKRSFPSSPTLATNCSL